MSNRLFWQRAARCRAGEATYFNGAMQPIIAAYGNVLQIEREPSGRLIP